MTRRQYPAWLRRRHRGAADDASMKQLAVALMSHDEDALSEILHPGVVLIIDSGGRIPDASEPIEGRAAASTELLRLMTSDTSVELASINGVPGLTLVRDRQVVGAVTGEMRSRLLCSLWVVFNPEKLRHWNRL